MEELSRIVARSMARHGCDRGVDHRRLLWSPWIRCQWSDDLLDLPSAAGILALAEDVGPLGPAESDSFRVAQRSGAAISDPESAALVAEGTAANLPLHCHSERSEAHAEREPQTTVSEQRSEQEFSPQIGQYAEVDGAPFTPGVSFSGEVRPRVLALFEIAETDDLGAAFLRLFSPHSGYRERVRSGRCFVRFTPVTDPVQRQSATRALRDWLHNNTAAHADPAATKDANEEISAA